MDATLESKIEMLNHEELHELEVFVTLMLGRRAEQTTKISKKEALSALEKHRGVLAGSDRNILRNQAMEEKYGHIS